MSEGDLTPVVNPRNQNASADISEQSPSRTTPINEKESVTNDQTMPESRHDDFEVDLVEDVKFVNNELPIAPKDPESQTTLEDTKKVEGNIGSSSDVKNLEVNPLSSDNAQTALDEKLRAETESRKPEAKTLIQSTTDETSKNTSSPDISQSQIVAKSIYDPRDPDDGDFDSEDEEFQTLVTAKKKQIRADIVAYQTYLELELVVYEKKLREDFARKKRRRAQQRNETTIHKPGSKTQQQYRLPTQFLPLLESSQNSPFPQSSSAIPSALAKSKSDYMENKEDESRLDPIETQEEINQLSAPYSRSSTPSPGLRPLKQVEGLKTPPRAPSPLVTPQASPSYTQPSIKAPETLAKLSFANLAHLDVKEKNQTPLASSIRSTSSWSSGNGKHSRKSSVAEGQERKKKRVVFQLMTEEGNCLRIRPDGEEIPLNESEKEQIKSEIIAAEVLEEEERIRSNIEINEGSPLSEPISETAMRDQVLSIPSYSDNASEITIEDLSEPNDDLGGETGDRDWVFTSSTPAATYEQGPGDSFSESDGDDDMFDLDEEVPLQYADAGRAPSASAAMEESIMSLGLPFAPAPPPPPAGEVVVTSPTQFGLLRRSNNLGVPDITAMEAPAIQQRSQTIGPISSSYISASLPLSSYSLVNPIMTSSASPTQKQDNIDGRSPSSTASRLNSDHDGPSYTSSRPNQQTQIDTIRRGGYASGSLGSPFRRRSVSKYTAKEADETDTEKYMEQTVQTQSVDAKIGLNKSSQTPAVIPVRTTATKEVDIMSSLSPYGTSAPIPIVRRSPVAQTVKSGSVTGNSPKDGSAGTPRRRKIGDPLPDIRPKRIEKVSPMGSLRQYALKSVEQNVTSKPIPDVDNVLSPAAQSLRRNSLPSTLKSEKPKIPKEEISRQWDEAHHQFITKPPAIMYPKTVQSLEKEIDPEVQPELFYKVAAEKARFERETQLDRRNEMEKNRDSLPSLLSTIKSNTNWVENPVTARPLSIKNDLAETFKGKGRSKVEEVDPKTVKPIFERKSIFSSKDAEKVAAAAAASENDEAEGFVGGVDGRSGIDASLVKHGTQNRKSFKAESIKPETMSFSMRMAMEEDKQDK